MKPPLPKPRIQPVPTLRAVCKVCGKEPAGTLDGMSMEMYGKCWKCVHPKGKKIRMR